MYLPKVYLASKSPRRKELLEQVGIAYQIVESSYEEPNNFSLNPVELVKLQALGKAKKAIIPPFSTHDRASETGHSEQVCSQCKIVLGADTIVVQEGRILGKPVDELEAEKMLQALSGQRHEVMTGVALVVFDEQGRIIKEESFVSITEVTFRELSFEEIKWYVATGEPLDKAGAYGIQGIGGLWVEKIVGSYTNVVGLPVEAVFQVLKKL